MIEGSSKLHWGLASHVESLIEASHTVILYGAVQTLLYCLVAEILQVVLERRKFIFTTFSMIISIKYH